jgi:hypothetical protein
MFLLGADETSRIAEEIIAAQRRLEILNRIILGLRALYSEAEAGEDEASGESEATSPSVLDRIDSEISPMIGETADDDTVRAMYRDLTTTRGQIGQHRAKSALLKATLDEIHAKIERCRSEAERLRESIRHALETLARTARVRDVLGDTPASKSKVLTFHRVLERARTEARDAPLRMRAASAFITTMSRTIEKRIADAKRLKFETDSLRREFEEAQRHVWSLYQMRIDEDDGIDRSITVEGAFEGDVRMFIDPRFMSRTETVAVESAFIPSPSNDGRVRFVCAGGRIREVAITAPAADAGAELSMA